MKKSFKILIFILLLLSLIGYIWYKDYWIKTNQTVKIEYFVSNNSWNTGRKKQIVSKKWDEVSFFFLIKNNENISKKIIVLIDEFINKYWLTWAYIDIQNDILPPNTTKIVKITWKSMLTSNLYKEIDSPIKLQNIDNLASSSSSFSSKIQLNQIKSKDKLVKNIKVNFDKNSILTNIDNLIFINWTWLDQLKAIWIWERTFPLDQKNSKYIIYIPKNTFMAGKFFTFVVLESWELISLDSTFEVTHSDQKLVIQNIFPPRIKNDTDRWITVQGIWLKNSLGVQLSDNTIFQKTDFKVVSDSVIAVKIPKWLSAWKYWLNIMTIDWIFELKDIYLEIYN